MIYNAGTCDAKPTQICHHQIVATIAASSAASNPVW